MLGPSSSTWRSYRYGSSGDQRRIWGTASATSYHTVPAAVPTAAPSPAVHTGEACACPASHNRGFLGFCWQASVSSTAHEPQQEPKPALPLLFHAVAMLLVALSPFPWPLYPISCSEEQTVPCILNVLDCGSSESKNSRRRSEQHVLQ